MNSSICPSWVACQNRPSLVGYVAEAVPAAVRRFIGAVLPEQHDEWVVSRRYLTPAALRLIRHTGDKSDTTDRSLNNINKDDAYHTR